MTLRTLKTRDEILSSRRELEREGLSFLGSWTLRTLRRYGLWTGVNVGHPIKSWDVLTTTRFLKEHVRTDDPILDLGAYTSEILPILHRLGYRSLTGIDLNPRTVEMPFAADIRYTVGDFLHTPFGPESFAAVTAVSVIEHGFQPDALLGEISRLLRPGGLFVASFDYWSDKIDTSSIRLFNMDWRIFSKSEVHEFLGRAADFGLVPLGEIQDGVGDKAVSWEGKQYTFAWLALRKRPGAPSGGQAAGTH